MNSKTDRKTDMLTTRTRVAAEELGYVSSMLVLEINDSTPFPVCRPRTRPQLAYMGCSPFVQGRHSSQRD